MQDYRERRLRDLPATLDFMRIAATADLHLSVTHVLCTIS